MFDYNQTIQQQQRQSEIAKRASATSEGWTQPVPNIFDKLFAALKPAKRTQQPAKQRSAAKPTLAIK